MGARHRVGIGLSYRPDRLHRLAELIPYQSMSLCISTGGSCWRVWVILGGSVTLHVLVWGSKLQ